MQWHLDRTWLAVYLLSIQWLVSKGEQTFYCRQDETVTVDVTSDNATIVTRLSGTNVYDDNLNCKWKITASSIGNVDKRIHVKVKSSDLDYAPDGSNCNSYDFVAVKEDYMSDSEENYYDWNDAELGHYFTWCGNMNPWYFSSRDGVLVVEFQTNDRNTYDQAGVVMEVSSFDMGSCPPEWTEEVSRNTNHCYKLRTHKETWSDAQDYCNKEQANLVSFADDTEAGFVTDLIQNSEGFTRYEKVWIGLNDIAVNDEYVWIDGISSSVTYRWKSNPHEADTYDNCVSVGYYDGLWQEEFCTESEIQTTTKNKFVCKTNKDGITSTHRTPDADKEPEIDDNPNFKPVVITCAAILLVIVIVLAVLLCSIFRRKRPRNKHRRNHPERRQSDTELQMNVVVPPPHQQDRGNQPRRSEGMILLGEENMRRQPSVPSAPPEIEYDENRRHSPPPSYNEAMNM